MAETLRELLGDARGKLERKANELVREDTTNDDLRELAYGIAREYAARACIFTKSVLEMLLASGDLGLGMMQSVPDNSYDRESPINVIERNIEEWLSDRLVDAADAIEEEWDQEREDAEADGERDGPFEEQYENEQFETGGVFAGDYDHDDGPFD